MISPVGPRSALWTSLAQVFLPVRRNERNLSFSPSYIFPPSHGPYSGTFYLLLRLGPPFTHLSFQLFNYPILFIQNISFLTLTLFSFRECRNSSPHHPSQPEVVNSLPAPACCVFSRYTPRTALGAYEEGREAEKSLCTTIITLTRTVATTPSSTGTT